MTNQALLLIDIQNDFCAGGALAVRDGDATVDIANRLLNWCETHGVHRVASLDWHPPHHGSFASVAGKPSYSQGQLDGLAQIFWPDHCIAQTAGAELHPLLQHHLIEIRITKGENPSIDSYSAFYDNGHRQATRLHSWLTRHQVKKLLVMGLATDYCVKFTVLDALTLGYEVMVITDGCRGVNINPDDSFMAFAEMAAAGATLYTLDDWLEVNGR